MIWEIRGLQILRQSMIFDKKLSVVLVCQITLTPLLIPGTVFSQQIILTANTRISAFFFTFLALFLLSALGEELNILTEEYAEVISGPSDDYQQVLKGEFKLNIAGVGQTVLGFKDEATGTFDTIRIYIPSALGEYIKSIEVFSGDSPTGPFKSVVKTTETQNAKIFKTKGWQELKFSPVKAKYFQIHCTTHDFTNIVRVVKDGTQPGLQFIGHVNPL